MVSLYAQAEKAFSGSFQEMDLKTGKPTIFVIPSSNQIFALIAITNSLLSMAQKKPVFRSFCLKRSENRG
ncbi:hypothetical protein EFB08_10915 [Rufibacter latericius]|uniref:Uncharacterized protein n=1 Tax=Rufibacter latericius TaxID=2487040 RepID=A0A3M9MN76_9BACT|nr:hypothetical protein EFB08_10915 [Rufibacter latericius]